MEFAVTFFQMYVFHWIYLKNYFYFNCRGILSLLSNELLLMMDFSSTTSEMATLGHLYDQVC